MSKPVFIGLDIECTASSLYGRTCQIGVSLGTVAQYNFVSDVGWDMSRATVVDRLEGEMVGSGPLVERDALKVNGFDMARIAAGADSLAVDAALYAFLNAHDITPKSKAIPVGFNVAGFDMPFVRRDLPLTGSCIHYRTVDLNAICFALGIRGQVYSRGEQGARGWESWKKLAKRQAAQVMGGDNWHDAGYDAQAALIMLRWLAEQDGTEPVL